MPMLYSGSCCDGVLMCSDTYKRVRLTVGQQAKHKAKHSRMCSMAYSRINNPNISMVPA